jgi:hypothetical protein
MDTLYSHILWEKMEKDPKEYQIHKKTDDEIKVDLIQRIDDMGAEEFEKEVGEVSFLDELRESEHYYDGQFYKWDILMHKDVVKESPDNPQYWKVQPLYHETSVDPTVLLLMMRHMHPETSKFLAELHAEWYKRKPKKESSCSIK